MTTSAHTPTDFRSSLRYHLSKINSDTVFLSYRNRDYMNIRMWVEGFADHLGMIQLFEGSKDYLRKIRLNEDRLTDAAEVFRSLADMEDTHTHIDLPAETFEDIYMALYTLDDYLGTCDRWHLDTSALWDILFDAENLLQNQPDYGDL